MPNPLPLAFAPLADVEARLAIPDDEDAGKLRARLLLRAREALDG